MIPSHKGNSKQARLCAPVFCGFKKWDFTEEGEMQYTILYETRKGKLFSDEFHYKEKEIYICGGFSCCYAVSDYRLRLLAAAAAPGGQRGGGH